MSFNLINANNALDKDIREILQDVRSGRQEFIGNAFSRRKQFINYVSNTLAKKYPGSNVVMIRRNQVHDCPASHVVRRITCPLPSLSGLFGMGTYDYLIYICQRGSFRNFGHGSDLDWQWAGNIEKIADWNDRRQILLLR